MITRHISLESNSIHYQKKVHSVLANLYCIVCCNYSRRKIELYLWGKLKAMRVITIVGARPQFIKAAAISRTIRAHFKEDIEEIILHTGQHYDANMSRVFFEDLEIPKPQYHLGIGSMTHGQQTGRMIEAIEKVLVVKKPDAVIVYGDTNTTLAGAMAASKLHIPVVHIEAGLRSYNKHMPEEVNRVLTDHMSTLLFSPTETGVQNLAKEGFATNTTIPHSVDLPGIYHSGDIMLDNTLFFAEKAKEKSHILKKLNPAKQPYVLATIHRPVNTDTTKNLQAVMRSLDTIAASGIKVILPLHPRTRTKLMEQENAHIMEMLEKNAHVMLSEPVSFLDMILLEKGAEMIITDSGGVQKEAYFLKKPAIIARNETEWTEIVTTGNAVLCGSSEIKIVEAFERFMNKKPDSYPAWFGDGQASGFICEKLLQSIAKP